LKLIADGRRPGAVPEIDTRAPGEKGAGVGKATSV